MPSAKCARSLTSSSYKYSTMPQPTRAFFSGIIIDIVRVVGTVYVSTYVIMFYLRQNNLKVFMSMLILFIRISFQYIFTKFTYLALGKTDFFFLLATLTRYLLVGTKILNLQLKELQFQAFFVDWSQSRFHEVPILQPPEEKNKDLSPCQQICH